MCFSKKEKESNNNAKLKQFQVVKLLNDKYWDQGVSKGDVGTILENYINGYYLVEFSDGNGITKLLDSFPEDELELVD